MAKKRVHEIAKEHGLSSRELLERLQAAGVDARVASSSVDEALALRALAGNGAAALSGTATRAADPQPESATGASSGGAGAPPSGAGGKRDGAADAAAAARGRGGGGATVAASPSAGRPGGASGGARPAPRAGTPASPAPSGRGPSPAGTGRGQPGQSVAGPAPRRSAAPAAAAGAQTNVAPAGEGSSEPARGERHAARPTRDSRTGERAPGGVGPGGRRRVVIDSQASRRQQTGPQQQQRRTHRGRRRRGTYDDTVAPLQSQELGPEERRVSINSGSTVKDVAEYLGVPVPEIIKKLMVLGEMATLTQTLSDEAIALLGEELGRPVEIVHAAEETGAEEAFEDAQEDLRERAPVVTIMGHVDHGKTSLLDAIRETEVAASEAGGITQHIGAYQVTHAGKKITFLDTPGHEAFTAMRARGARVTDVAVIVVAADDGVKPQTEEAIDHARAAGVPVVVAVNKIDKDGAQPDRVRTEMAQRGLQPVQWGGETEFVDVSAKSRQGLEDLLETIQVVTELEELQANPKAPGSGTVIESKLDPGRGPVVTILVQRGTLHVGDALVAGVNFGRVRAMHDWAGGRVKRALPGEPVEVLGFDGVPEAGESVRAVENDRRARQIAGERANRLKSEAIARRAGRKISLEDVFKLAQEGAVKELNLVVKADVAGSLEAIEDEIAKLPQAEVSVNIIHRGVGGINESDVMLAAASNGLILAFNVRPVGDARRVAEQQGVEIRAYSVIYRAIEDLRAAMQGMLEPEEVESPLGQAEIRQIFRASRVGTIAGSYVTEGRVRRGARLRVVRDGKVIYETTVASLRRFNEDAQEVASGFECGITLANFQDLREGDVLEIFETRSVERELS